MSVSRVFSIIGDSNVRQNMTSFNIRDRAGLSDAQVLTASRLEVLPDALRSVRASSNIVILSCITNYLTSSEASSSVSGRVSPLLVEFRQHVDSFVAARPTTMVMVAPPMFRAHPHWYNVGLPEILVEFSSVMSTNRPGTLHLLESFPTPEFQADGVHLTAYSGLRLVYPYCIRLSLIAFDAFSCFRLSLMRDCDAWASHFSIRCLSAHLTILLAAPVSQSTIVS